MVSGGLFVYTKGTCDDFVQHYRIFRVKKLEEKVEQLQDEMNKLDEDFKQRRLKDSEIIQRLNEELITHNENRKAILREISIYQQAVEDAR